jgi:hypothetical protein
VYFPYCIERQENGSWVILNRNYKPVGLNTGKFIKYGDYPVSIRLKGLGPATLKRLSCKDEEPKGRVYLYTDSCIPTSGAKAMSSYLKKLEILLKIQTNNQN